MPRLPYAIFHGLTMANTGLLGRYGDMIYIYIRGLLWITTGLEAKHISIMSLGTVYGNYHCFYQKHMRI